MFLIDSFQLMNCVKAILAKKTFPCNVLIKDSLVHTEYKDSQYHVSASRPGGKPRIHGKLTDLPCGGDIH